MGTLEQKLFIQYALELTAIGFISFVLIATVILLSIDPESYASGFSQKIERLRAAPSPRLIIVGGSGVDMAIDSDMIRQKTGYNPVNMGVFAGVGLRFMFHSIERDLREGDVVLLIPESELIQQPPYGAGYYLLEILHANPLYILDALTLHGAVVMTRHFPNWLQNKVKSIYVRKIESLFFIREPVLSDVVYNIYNFNAYGDTDSTVAGDHHLTTEEVIKSYSGYVGDVGVNPSTMTLLKNTITTLEKRQVKVFVSWQAMAKSIYNVHTARVEERVSELEKELGRDHLIGSFKDFIVPDDVFLDASSHLTDAGKREYTKLLIPLLIPYLKVK